MSLFILVFVICIVRIVSLILVKIVLRTMGMAMSTVKRVQQIIFRYFDVNIYYFKSEVWLVKEVFVKVSLAVSDSYS